MSWIFEGSCADISLSLSEVGHWSVHGAASQDCRPIGDDFEIIRHVRDLQGLWSIHSSEDAEHHYDGVGYGLKKAFQANGGRSVAMIHYFAVTKNEKAAIGLNVLIPPGLLAEVVATFRTALASPSVRYVISPYFHGIGEQATEMSPSIGQFMHAQLTGKRAYFSGAVSISFRSSQQ